MEDIVKMEYKNLTKNLDGSYTFDKNGLPYNCPNFGEWAEEYAQVHAYALDHPDEVTEQTPPPQPSLDDLKAAKRAEVTAWRDAAIAQGTEWSGHTVDTDSDAQRMVTALMVKMQTYKTIGREWTPAPWRLKDGTYITLTEDQATALALAVSDYVSSCYAREGELAQAVTAAETREELDALSWEA